MSLNYSAICAINIELNFLTIENILKHTFSIHVIYIDFDKKADVEESIEYLKKMKIEDDPLILTFFNKKHNQYYNIFFTEFDNKLRIGLVINDCVKKVLFYEDIEYPNMAFYLKILLDLVTHYTITEIKIDYSF